MSRSLGSMGKAGLAALALVAVVGCGPKEAVSLTSISVRISPEAATIAPGGTQAFAPTVAGTRNTAVTWSVEGGEANGSVSEAGVYTAPQTPGAYTVVVTSQEAPTKSARATVTVVEHVEPPIRVTITPADASLMPGETFQFTATVFETDVEDVIWSVEETGGGTVSVAGLYRAPSRVGTYHVIATSVADETKSGRATVNVLPQEIAGTVNYSGIKTGRVYLTYGSNPVQYPFGGTSIAAPGEFTIEGLRLIGQSGDYEVFAFIDTQGSGVFNSAVDPSGTVAFGYQENGVEGLVVNLTDPAAAVPPTPQDFFAAGHDGLVYASFSPVRVPFDATDAQSPRVEAAEKYKIYWSTLPTVSPTLNAGSVTIEGGNAFPSAFLPLANGTYYFTVTALTGAQESAPAAAFGPVVIADGVGGVTVSGTIDLPETTGTLYVILASAEGVVKLAKITALAATTDYAIGNVADGNYGLYVLLDRDGDGVPEPLAPSNYGSPSFVSVAGSPVTAPVVALSSEAAATFATNEYTVYPGGQTYTQFYIGAYAVRKRPVTVKLSNGPYFALPSDLGASVTQGYHLHFGGASGKVDEGSQFSMDVTYGDGTSGTLTAAFSNVVDTFQTLVAPTGATTSTPTFTWGEPTGVTADWRHTVVVLKPSATGGSWSFVWYRTLRGGTTSVQFNDDATATQMLTPGQYYWYMTLTDPAGNSGTNYAGASLFTVQ